MVTTRPKSRVVSRKKPSITMQEFFALPLVRSLQDLQKASPYGSAVHREAFLKMKEEARKFRAEDFFGEY